ncbi:lysozyme inhibitor LprI family protein [Gilliamella apicola]|uniref:lysozyme inhibitor LprI family protein n=1 Tax=Gilliamella apicola TaxID=1196095 RepID=UPI003986E316
MKIIKLITLFIIITPLSVFANLKYANFNQFELRNYCNEKVFSQVAVANCLEKIFYISEAELDKSQWKLSNVLSKWDEGRDYIVRAKNKLKKSHKEFIKYRDRECDFAHSLGGGAIGLNKITYSCLAELNFQQAKLLDLYRSEAIFVKTE